MKIIIYGERTADVCLIRMIDDHDAEFIQKEYRRINAGCKGIKPLLVAVQVDDWNKDLSPWKTGAVFGNESFGEGAKDTPTFLADKLLPEIREHYFVDRANTISSAGILWRGCLRSGRSTRPIFSPLVWQRRRQYGFRGGLHMRKAGRL